MKKLHFLAPVNARFIFQSHEKGGEKNSHSSDCDCEKAKNSEVSKSQRELLKSQVEQAALKNNQQDKLASDKDKKKLTYSGNALRIHGLGTGEARLEAMHEQFSKTKNSLDQRQRHLEKLYLGHKGNKAFFEVFEKHLGRAFDTRTGLIGGFGKLLSLFGASYNRSLETKMQKQVGVSPENLQKIYQETQAQLEKNKIHFEEMERTEAANLGLTVKEFQRSGEYKSWKSDVISIGLSLGLNALGLSTGVFLPAMHFNPRRKAFAMDANAAIKYMDEGMSYTDAIKQVSQDTDKSVFMAHNLMRSANVLIAGPEGNNLAHVDKRWENFQIMRSELTFDKNSYTSGNSEVKSLYESLGFTIDSQGIVHLKEAKKMKNILFRWGERWFGDAKANRAYRKAVKVLRKNPQKGKLSESEIIRLNQEKIGAVETIVAMMKQENAEDWLKRSSYKNDSTRAHFEDAQSKSEIFNKDELKKRFARRPDKMEGRVAALQQMERFLESQRVLVRNQREFYAFRSLENGAENQSEILYKGAVLGFLSSFQNLQEVCKYFPDIVNKSKEVRDLLNTYFWAKASTDVNENTVLNKMVESAGFRTWLQEVGTWSNLQKHQNPDGYDEMPCADKIEYDYDRINCVAKKHTKDYEFKSIAAVAPRGQGSSIPIGIHTGLFSNFLDIGKSSIQNTTEDVLTTDIVERIIKDPITGADIVIEVPVETMTTVITGMERFAQSTINRAIGDYGAPAAAVLTGLLFPGETGSRRRVKKDAKIRNKKAA